MTAYTEQEIRDAAALVIADAPGGFITTTSLIDELTVIMKPDGRDADILDGRSDTYFSQKVRNLVSHRNQSTGLQAQGIADYDANREGWIKAK